MNARHDIRARLTDHSTLRVGAPRVGGPGSGLRNGRCRGG